MAGVWTLVGIKDTYKLGGAKCECGASLRYAWTLTNGTDTLIMGQCCALAHLDTEVPEFVTNLRAAMLKLYQDGGAITGAEWIIDHFKTSASWMRTKSLRHAYTVKRGGRVPAKVLEVLKALGTAYEIYRSESLPLYSWAMEYYNTHKPKVGEAHPEYEAVREQIKAMERRFSPQMQALENDLRKVCGDD